MIIGKEIRLESALKGCDYAKIRESKFVDKNRSPGLAVGGKFADLEELRQECSDYDVYIVSINEAIFSDLKGYWAIYACRDKTHNGGLAVYRG